MLIYWHNKNCPTDLNWLNKNKVFRNWFVCCFFIRNYRNEYSIALFISYCMPTSTEYKRFFNFHSAIKRLRFDALKFFTCPTYLLLLSADETDGLKASIKMRKNRVVVERTKTRFYDGLIVEKKVVNRPLYGNVIENASQ